MKNYGFLTPYMINKTQDGYFIRDCNGFVKNAEETIEIAKGLICFSKKHQEEIEQYNIQRNIEFEKELFGYCKNSKKEKSKGYIYLFECGGKYKIGYSKNVERRLKELDNRPFKINLIAKSVLSDKSYHVEQKLHSIYEKNKIDGEWYSFNNNQLKELIYKIENMEVVEHGSNKS